MYGYLNLSMSKFLETRQEKIAYQTIVIFIKTINKQIK